MQKGFTLLEVMVVLFILVTVAALAVGAYQGQLAQAKRQSAVVYIKGLASAIELFELNIGRPPTSDEGLNALIAAPGDLSNPAKWSGPYIKETVQTNDPWGNSYQYVCPSARGKGNYDVWSWGPDGINETDDDIGQWTND
ncbi:MAG: type II secretion system major pseudopilin GspG [Planctomycetaceae bacterium]|jgi:general secretion pathway protein G|nr:type II secretion system major pseudopilin GspG [Planctomycetaceae bacterium]